MQQYKVVILANETQEDTRFWELACQRHKQVNYRIVDLTKNSWLEEIQKETFDFLLTKPGGLTSVYKQLYDERIYILSEVLNYKIFPTPKEIFIYENKRFLSFWLKATNLPHPKTDVFYSFREANEYINQTEEDIIVAKTNIGASGSGVKILKYKKEKQDYLKDVFFGKGAAQRSGPNLKKGSIFKRGVRYIMHPKEIKKKLNIYKAIKSNPQKDFVIFQQYIPHDFEWRVVRIGDSFFAHKKLKLGEKASGSLLKRYDNPPIKLFDFVKKITDEYQFYSQAVDIFESNGDYLVNEMQCIFGQSDHYQMLVDGKPGRYRYIDNNWFFEEGDYAKNACYDLRIEFLINQLQNA